MAKAFQLPQIVDVVPCVSDYSLRPILDQVSEKKQRLQQQTESPFQLITRKRKRANVKYDNWYVQTL